jgi:hypothetical protein
MSPHAQITVGVVVERRKAASHWIDFTWQPVAILAGQPAASPWTVLCATAEMTSYYAGTTDVLLYRSEADRYRENLASGAPSLWVALRASGNAEAPFQIVAVTADPAEGESFTQVGDDIVEALPMPTSVRVVIETLVADCPVADPFVKRDRDRSNPEALAMRGPMQKGQKE